MLAAQMLMMSKAYENPDDEKLAEVRRHMRIWRRRFLSSTFALLLSCALVHPFLAGRRQKSFPVYHIRSPPLVSHHIIEESAAATIFQSIVKYAVPA